MNLDMFLALVSFSFVSSITPGPNNIMLMTSGANFGFKRTLPHMLGVGIGFIVMVLLVGIGIMQLFDLYPVSYQVLKVLSLLYLCYLAYRIATSHSIKRDSSSAAKPLTFLQAALFQWVNPKAWTMAVTAITLYAPSKSLGAVGLVALVFGVINIPSVCVWVLLGRSINNLLRRPRTLQVFNVTMALLLILSVVLVI